MGRYPCCSQRLGTSRTRRQHHVGNPIVCFWKFICVLSSGGRWWLEKTSLPLARRRSWWRPLSLCERPTVTQIWEKMMWRAHMRFMFLYLWDSEARNRNSACRRVFAVVRTFRMISQRSSQGSRLELGQVKFYMCSARSKTISSVFSRGNKREQESLKKGAKVLPVWRTNWETPEPGSRFSLFWNNLRESCPRKIIRPKDVCARSHTFRRHLMIMQLILFSLTTTRGHLVTQTGSLRIVIHTTECPHKDRSTVDGSDCTM